MVENIQCPVCTLFLHAGMNLSDHLETHPKEQVIKALVQMTINGGGPGASAISAALADKDKTSAEPISNAPKNEKEHEGSLKSVGTLSSSSPTPSSNNNLKLSFCAPQKHEKSGFTTTHTTTGKHIFNQQNVTSSPAYQKCGEPQSSISGGINDIGTVRDIAHMPNDFSAFSNRYQNQHPHQQLHQQQHQQQQQQQTSSQLHQQNVAISHQRPPPPPPLPHLPRQIAPLASNGGSQGFHTMPHHQPPMLAHQHPNSIQHAQAIQQQQHPSAQIPQQQNLKVIYSSTLPPPPPLQLFSYQPPAQPQHQKPPPAYGTAISQIRSQHNQHKHTISQNQMQQQRTAPMSAIATTSKHAISKQNLPLPPTPLTAGATQPKQYQLQHHETLMQQQHQQQQQQIIQQQYVKNSIPNTSLVKTTGTYQQRVQTPLTGLSAPSGRQTVSPYPTILAAAMASPSSSSSVLRYAESPVTAHYLERDNGDFIVQETPKHIVECVEKDNGEFSVIERIYQSPPSVLHIHDDDDEEDDDDNDGDDGIKHEVDSADDSDVKIVVDDENNKFNKNDEKINENHEDDEEFMSADSISDIDDLSEKSMSKGSRKFQKGISSNNPNTEPTAVNSSAFSETDIANSNSNSNSTTTTTNNNISRKKSSKNTITVLSDVQLNLNEYLDLVGNIIASSKIAQNHTAYSATAALPMPKIEKIEPLDEYEQNDDVAMEESDMNSEVQMDDKSLIEPPKTTNNKDNITETDELVENKYSSNKSSLNETNTNKVVTTTPEESKLIKPTSAVGIYSGHATSVIRMATTSNTSQPFMPETEHQSSNALNMALNDKNVHSDDMQQEKCHDVQDLSQTKIKCESSTEDFLQKVPPPPIPLPPLKKGPKKLVIKPKSNKTDANCEKTVGDNVNSNTISDEQPTTSAKAQKQIENSKIEQNKATEHTGTHEMADPDVVIKSEPCTVAEQPSILEQHLKTGLQHNLEPKNEHSPARYDTIFSLDSQKIKCESDEFNDVPKIYTESNHSSVRLPNSTEDSRVLLNFANSKDSKADATSTAVSFPSSNSIFATSSIEKSITTSSTCLSSSTSSAQNTTTVVASTGATNLSTSNSASAAVLSTLRCDDEFIVPDATDVQEIVISSSYSSQSATDIALTNCNNAAVNDQHQHNFSDYPFSFLYGGGSVAQQIEIKGNFSPIYQHQPHDATTAATLASGSNSATIEEFAPAQSSSHQQRYNSAPSGAGQWYHAVSTSNADFEAALAVDCGEADNDVGKYLDLDSCKRDNMNAAQAAPCSSSSSFTAATESSLAGCTTDALNIRTDEKMPAKGEISEQESNCDIENSWSQPMYGDIPARYFKTSFPGLFPQDNWASEEYFTVQDLSASTTNASNRATKSFDFRLPLETTATNTTPANSFQQSNLTNLPSSSKKKRKRDANVAKNLMATSRKVAATVTSQELLLQEQRQEQQHQQQQQQQQLQLYHQQPTTSGAILAGPSNAGSASAITSASSSVGTSAAAAAAAAAAVAIQKLRRKTYQCVHCPLKFTKLKDRNSHMIVQHNYVRQNRRLVYRQNAAVATVTSATATVTSAENIAIPINGPNTSSNIQTIPPPPSFGEVMEDSKQSIIKIEVENVELTAGSMPAIETVMAKTEFIDEKDSLALVPTTSSPNAVADLKPPNVRPLALTSATKLATLYRMLVSFNISTLKQNTNLTEMDEKLIESCIFFCYTCRQNFNTVKLYDAHLTEHPAECFTCGKKFHRWKNFSLHLKRHLGWKEFGCNVCDKKFVVRSALVEHMRMHTGLTPLKCKICGKNFKRYSNLTQHRKRHGRPILRKKEFVCHCGEVLPSKARFLWHKETHDAKPKCCPYCCDRFVHANSLRRHIRLAHSDKFDYTEPMECPMCKQVFAKSSIKAHMATHSMDTQYDCAICNKSFSTKWNLKIHSWVHANRTAKPFKCEHCPKAFVREVDFKNHMNAHKQIKPYTCEYCGCKFIRKYNYMRHRREHHGNKKFTCDLCKKSFHRHYYLIEHRRIHTGERPFQCTICGKSSTTKTNHNKHLKIHHSRDPFTVEA